MELTGKRALVTGGAGFVGSVLARRLVEGHGAIVTVLDDLTTGNWANIAALKVDFVEGSVEDKKLVADSVAASDIIFHLAARGIVPSSTYPEEDYGVNIGGTLNLLCAATKYSIEKFVYTSTSSIYGNPRYLPTNEDDSKGFLNLYSVSKYAAECYCRAFCELNEAPITILRLSNVYGENQNPENRYCGVIGKFISAALKGEDLRVHGDGDQTRDYTFVDDAVEAIIRAATSPRSVDRVYNVGTGREVTVNQLARMTLDLCGSNSKVVHIDRRDIDNIRRRVLNIERIRHDLKWIPQVTLEEGLARTIEWMTGPRNTEIPSEET